MRNRFLLILNLICMLFITSCKDSDSSSNSSNSTTVKKKTLSSTPTLASQDCGKVQNGATITRTMYLKNILEFGQNCEDVKEVQEATCENGKISKYSGNATYKSCKAKEPKNCGETLHGEKKSRVRYNSNLLEYGKSCEDNRVKEVQEATCENGKISKYSGNATYESCKVKEPKNCGEILHGEKKSRIRYNADVVEFGKSCEDKDMKETQESICNNGLFSKYNGNASYSNCIVKEPINCSNIAHGEQATEIRYTSSSVKYGKSCDDVKKVKTSMCYNGSLNFNWSKKATHLSCKVEKEFKSFIEYCENKGSTNSESINNVIQLFRLSSNNKESSCKELYNTFFIRKKLSIGQRLNSLFRAYDFAPIASLTNLEELELKSSLSASINALKRLKKLTKLKMSGSGFKDLSVLGSLENLTDLHLIETDPEAIISLNNYSNITKLKISFSKMKKIPELNKLTKLTILDINFCNELVDISNIGYLKSLKKLSLSRNSELKNITSIGNLTMLHTLRVSYSEVEDISSLNNLKNLIEIRLNNNSIKDIYPLANLTKLETVYVPYNKINTIPDLSQLTLLEKLYISNNFISDVSELIKINPKMLRHLYVNKNKITDITELKYLKNLEMLNLSNNKISDISPLYNLKNLEELRLSKTGMNEILNLEKFHKLSILDLAGNNLKVIPSIKIPQNLRRLYLLDNPIEDISDIIPYHTEIDNLEVKINNEKYLRLIGYDTSKGYLIRSSILSKLINKAKLFPKYIKAINLEGFGHWREALLKEKFDDNSFKEMTEEQLYKILEGIAQDEENEIITFPEEISKIVVLLKKI